ncbi:hypothetical protein [Staphylococcus sp. GDY8P72P]|uniref:hypothetical protein n=1 Tax=Staphylococcus sp. GDY8P72P TaxID=2804425 RepID=UPI00194E5DC1|nr:hypothetical protein [Staphylococcus sp. GDY8P72P]
MNIEILNAFEEMTSASNKVYSLNGEMNRLSELVGILSEKVKAYREEGDNLGANAIANIALDDIEPVINYLYEDFHKSMKEFEQKTKRLKNVCAFHGINVQLGKDNKVINFYKESR